MSDYIPDHRSDEEPVIGDAPPRAHVLFSNEVYDKLKFVALIVLPALGTLYFSISVVTGLPYGQEVVGVIVAIDTFLGALLGVSSSQYQKDPNRFDGEIQISANPETGNADMNVRLDRTSVANKDEVVVKIERE